MTIPHDPTPSPSSDEENLIILPHRSSSERPPSSAGDILPTALGAAVPLWVFEIYERGGPSQEDWERLPQLGRLIAEQGDHLLYRSSREGETAKLFNAVAEALALCSFVVGGISFGNQQFEALQILTFFLGAEKAEQYVREARRRAVSGGQS